MFQNPFHIIKGKKNIKDYGDDIYDFLKIGTIGKPCTNN